MQTNVGGLDRGLRIVGGLTLIGLVLADAIGAWGLIGVVPLVTGVLRWCPAYTLFGISSCPAATKR
ncbi:MAG TPA: DUF2892 domain-containing protein [Methylibium sp.]|nr:DUF2892 domain-containing protein [Methylibium sp.]